jgi:hypothetical protein
VEAAITYLPRVVELIVIGLLRLFILFWTDAAARITYGSQKIFSDSLAVA